MAEKSTFAMGRDRLIQPSIRRNPVGAKPSSYRHLLFRSVESIQSVLREMLVVGKHRALLTFRLFQLRLGGPMRLLRFLDTVDESCFFRRVRVVLAIPQAKKP